MKIKDKEDYITSLMMSYQTQTLLFECLGLIVNLVYHV